MKTVLAFDFGASSGRAIRAVFDGEAIAYEEVHRFENVPVTVGGHMCHDVERIMGEIRVALEKAGPVDSLAFDTWGVDYGLLDGEGRLLRPPCHYRDGRTAGAVEQGLQILPAGELYAETGNQIMEINTLFQLMRENPEGAQTLLFMPDLFAYLLSGAKVCERSIASTSQMLNPTTGDWSGRVMAAFGVDRGLFPPLTDGGTVTGEYQGIKVVTVAGHDTQCAVAAMPVSGKQEGTPAFLSCGTWSLPGCELKSPVLTEEGARLGISNELGAGGKVNCLKNISGLWLIQELRRNLAETDRKYSYNELETLAGESCPFRSLIDPDAGEFAAPGGMPEKIRACCRRTGQPVPETVGQLVRCIYESLALKYRVALEQIGRCTGRHFDVLHLLGGGTKDGFLCRLTADSLGIPVKAGPVEATALGNVLLQLMALGELESVEEGRRIIARTEPVKCFEPNHTEEWEEAFARFIQIFSMEV